MKTETVYSGKQARLILLILISLATVLPAALAAAAESGKNDDYFVLKGGYYYPSPSRLSLNDFEDRGTRTQLESKNGFDGEIAVGHYFIPIFGIELGAGYFESKAAPLQNPGRQGRKWSRYNCQPNSFFPWALSSPMGKRASGLTLRNLRCMGISAASAANRRSPTVFIGVPG